MYFCRSLAGMFRKRVSAHGAKWLPADCGGDSPLRLAWLIPGALFGAAPLLVLWIASPEIARLSAQQASHRISETLKPRQALSAPSSRGAHGSFFETFAGTNDTGGCRQPLQGQPRTRNIAHRTSPTNVGSCSFPG